MRLKIQTNVAPPTFIADPLRTLIINTVPALVKHDKRKPLTVGQRLGEFIQLEFYESGQLSALINGSIHHRQERGYRLVWRNEANRLIASKVLVDCVEQPSPTSAMITTTYQLNAEFDHRYEQFKEQLHV